MDRGSDYSPEDVLTKTLYHKKGKGMKKGMLVLLSSLIMSTSLYASSYNEALKLFQGKKYKESLDIIAELLSIEVDMEPDSPNYKLRYLAAHNHWKLGNHKAAITHFKRCMDIKQDEVNPYIDLSLMLIELRQYRDVNNFAIRGLKIKEEPMLYYILGRAALGYKNYWRSKELFEKSIAINPEMHLSYNELGIVLMKLKMYSRANTAFSAALALMPESPEIMNNIALSLEIVKKYDDAYSYLTRANALSPDNPVIVKNLNRIKARLNR
jgi:tetratricopeptide (TPR) repeat protein